MRIHTKHMIVHLSNKRLMELSQDFAHRPIVFIRINPDGYTDVHDKYINSPFGEYVNQQVFKL